MGALKNLLLGMEVRVDFLDEYGNDPEFRLVGVAPGEWPEPSAPVWEKRGCLHRADDGLWVHYFYSDGEPTGGFSGATFKGTLKDGTPFNYKGAWSSRAACISAAWPESPVVDVTCACQATAVPAEVIINWWREHQPAWGLAWCEDGGERILLPTRNGVPKNKHDKVVPVV